MKVKKIAEETANTENRTYAEVTSPGRNPRRRLSKTDNTDNKRKENILEKLRSIGPTN